MTDESRAKREALAWWIRLCEPSITNERVESYFAWRRAPGNLSAYNAVAREARERAARAR